MSNAAPEPVQPSPSTLARIESLQVNGAVLDLSQQYIRKELGNIILQQIDAYAVERYNDGFRTHLGASLIGNECSRATWYSWRWMADSKTSGRTYRLFNRGHREEARFIEYLQGIGFEVWDCDPNTGKQFRVSRVGGHFGGSLDSILRPPSYLALPSNILFLGEYKTKGTGSGFTKLKSDGIMLTNGQHYDQMCTYGANYGYEYAMYFAVNKNDDDMHVEIVKLNFARAREIEAKAEYIIKLNTPPPKISLQDTHYKCKMCDYIDICHHDALPAKNCRSCVHSRPINDAKWTCLGYNIVLEGDVIKTGCKDNWTPIK